MVVILIRPRGSSAQNRSQVKPGKPPASRIFRSGQMAAMVLRWSSRWVHETCRSFLRCENRWRAHRQYSVSHRALLDRLARPLDASEVLAARELSPASGIFKLHTERPVLAAMELAARTDWRALPVRPPCGRSGWDTTKCPVLVTVLPLRSRGVLRMIRCNL